MLIKNLESREEMTDAILSWMPDWISQDAFDQRVRDDGRRFDELDTQHGRRLLRGRAMQEDECILPSMAGNTQGLLGDFIFLVQALVARGHVVTKDDAGKVWYKRT